MNVLYVSKALVVAAYRDKLHALAAHADVTAIVPERWGRALPEPGAAVTTLPCVAHGHNHLHIYRGMGRVLDTLQPDLVHIDEEPYSAVTLQLARLCRERALPCLFFAWQNVDKRLPPPFGWLRRRVFQLVSGGIAGSDTALTVLRRAGFDGPAAVVPQFGIDPQRFSVDDALRACSRAGLGYAPGDFVVGYGGRLVPEKGVHVLLEAVAAVDGAHLLILGDGPERARLERRAIDLGVRARVRFHGPVPSCDMPAQLAACDVLVLPSIGRAGWTEQFGRILVEAMACGVPVIGSDAGEIPHVIGGAGVIVPPGDAPALARALRELAQSRAARAELGQLGRRRAVAEFGNDRIAARTVDFYHQLLAQRTHAASR